MLDVNYEFYKVFYRVAKSLSFSDAAAELFISQSAVSQSIKTLEKRLGQTLFVRSTKKVTLTKEGELLFKHIEPAIGLISQAEDQLTAAKETGEAQLKIAASDTLCRYLLVPYINEFHQKYPDVHIKVVNATSSSCAALLEDNKVDLIISNSPNPTINNTMTVVNVAEFSDVFVANKNAFPLEGQKVKLRDLSTYPILMLEKLCTTSLYLHDIFRKQSIDLVPSIELTSNDLLLDLAEIGLGIAFIPDFVLSRCQNKDMIKIETEEIIPPRKIVAAYDSEIPLSAPCRYFLEMLASK